MKFKTVSGSVYEIEDGYVTRTNPDRGMRADGKSIQIFNTPIVEVGQPVLLVLESLFQYGHDSYDTPESLVGLVTTRMTSVVTEVYDA